MTQRCIIGWIGSLIVLCLVVPSWGATLFVDKDNTTNCNGTTTQPYCTIQQAFNVANPGDTIAIRDSATPYDQSATLSRSGSSGNPIVITKDTGHNPIIRYTGNDVHAGAFNLYDVSYITIQGLTFDGAGIFTSQHALDIRSSVGTHTNISLLNNTFKNWGGTEAQQGANTVEHAVIYVLGDTTLSNFVVQGNLFDGNRHSDVRQIFNVDGALYQNNEHKNNLCGKNTDGSANAIGLHIVAPGRSNTGTTVRNNTFHDFQQRTACGLTGAYDTLAAVWCDESPANGLVENNAIWNIQPGQAGGTDPNGNSQEGVGIFIERFCQGWTVRNNLIYNVGGAGIRQRQETSLTQNVYYNNTIHNITEHGFQVGASGGNLTFENNIVSNTAGDAVHFDTPYTHTKVVDRNLYTGTNVGEWGWGNHLNFTNWKSQCGCDASSINASPVYASTTPGNPNFLKLQAGSPGINQGLTIPSVTVDFAGVARPQPPGGAYDIGGYEFISATGTPPVVTITAPNSGNDTSVTTTPLTTLAGTATDSDGTVSSVTWACPTCTPTSGTATGTTSWSVATIGLAVGANVITVTGTDNDSNTATDTITVTLLATTLRIDAGGAGGAFSDGTYQADAFVTGGTALNRPGQAIANTTDDVLYASERWGAMTYTLPLQNGTYTVTLKFAEMNATAVGQRMFNVDMQGTRVLTNFDIFALAGANTALDQSFTATVSTGVLTVAFTTVAGADNPEVVGLTAVPLVITQAPVVLRLVK